MRQVLRTEVYPWIIILLGITYKTNNFIIRVNWMPE